MRRVWLVILVAGSLIGGCAGNRDRSVRPTGVAARDSFMNPLDVLVADPFIYREGDTYYLYGTADEPGLVVWSSKNLVDWERRGQAFLPSKQTWSQADFWAPELIKHEGKYYLHFTARPEKLPPGHRVVLAEGDSPVGPFQELVAPWYEPGQNVIDSHVFKDDDGGLYLYSVHIPRPGEKGFEIRVRRLDDRLRPMGESVKCIGPSQPWEGEDVNEGPFVLKRGETYILTYSANPYFDPNYSVGYATAKSPMGPWVKAKEPVLKRTKEVSGPGHHCFVDSPDGREWFIAYHTHQNLAKPDHARQLAIDRVRFSDGTSGPAVVVDGPTVTPQPMPAGTPPLLGGGADEFDRELDRRRWTIFQEDPARWSIGGRRLAIRTGAGDVYQDRADLRNLFLRRAPRGDFDVTTHVTVDPQKEYEQASLYVWQDIHNYVKLAVVNVKGQARLEMATEVGGTYAFELLDLGGLSPAGGIRLRIVRTGDEYEFLAGDGQGGSWRTLGTREAKLAELRAGIAATAPGSERQFEASFDFLRFGNAVPVTRE